MSEYKEVYFNEYCKRCEFRDTSESEDPCDYCLSMPSNLLSHRPVRFKEKEKNA